MDDEADEASPLNEWYKAAAWINAEQRNALYGFGRDALTQADANFLDSNDPAEPGTLGNSSNVMHHEYRVLNDGEKADMLRVKDKGLDFHDTLGSLGSSRELSLAKTKIEEAVMWAVKHITQ